MFVLLRHFILCGFYRIAEAGQVVDKCDLNFFHLPFNILFLEYGNLSSSPIVAVSLPILGSKESPFVFLCTTSMSWTMSEPSTEGRRLLDYSRSLIPAGPAIYFS